ncbi:MAG: HTH domain-containing protein [Brevinema sp.]
MKFLELVEKVLQQSPEPMYYMDIWNKAVELGYDKELPVPNQGKRLTPWITLGARLYVDLQKNPKSIFTQTGRGIFYLKSKMGAKAEEISQKISNETLFKYSEQDLHPRLVTYLNEKLDVVSKTIVANSSKNSGEMRWGTPDITGVLFREDLDSSLKKLCQTANIPIVEIYAYELKKSVTFANYTECFFQAVSNSSWAHEGWLVAPDFEDNLDFEKELERLNQSFGIGILELNFEDPIASIVKYPARKKLALDLDTMNKLCKNIRFKEFLDDIETLLKQDSKTRKMTLNGMRNAKRFDMPEENS